MNKNGFPSFIMYIYIYIYMKRKRERDERDEMCNFPRLKLHMHTIAIHILFTNGIHGVQIILTHRN